MKMAWDLDECSFMLVDLLKENKRNKSTNIIINKFIGKKSAFVKLAQNIAGAKLVLHVPTIKMSLLCNATKSGTTVCKGLQYSPYCSVLVANIHDMFNLFHTFTHKRLKILQETNQPKLIYTVCASTKKKNKNKNKTKQKTKTKTNTNTKAYPWKVRGKLKKVDFVKITAA